MLPPTAAPMLPPSYHPSQTRTKKSQVDFSHRRHRLLITAFIDLDNVTPKTFRRSKADDLIRPLLEFERRVNHDGHGDRRWMRIKAFRNLSTRSWRDAEEKAHDVKKQDYIPWTTTPSSLLSSTVLLNGIDDDPQLDST